ncbi:hypothetical protein [Thalassoglobus polymorphus]|uniref:Uncharacterized protein n=1 Tax=Thalassoglobus polymorphus TaxID=2527994 RepID=A0A517QSP3_9PLAN|nr:hypothetical protein [Thalassoglobus polymorphus]QDT34654.1 hypothetical protein Mal48_39220 [Thalassoglobus polymorphus]
MKNSYFSNRGTGVCLIDSDLSVGRDMNVASASITKCQVEATSAVGPVWEKEPKIAPSQPEFRIHEFQNRNWVVFDQSDEVRFSGSLGECEDWLDWEENQEGRKGLIKFVQVFFASSR